MNNEKEFLAIVNRFIDSITSVNQNLGSVRELLNILLQKIDNQKQENDRFEAHFDSIEKVLKDISASLEKNDSAADIYKDIVDSKKDEMNLRIEELKALTTERVEEKKAKTTVTLERWKLVAAIVTALITATSATLIGVMAHKETPKIEKAR